MLQPLRKKQRQEQESSRFVPCPVCNRSFPSYFIHDHVHLCLDSPATGRTQSSSSTTVLSSSCDSQRLHLSDKDDDRFCSVDVEKDSNSESVSHRNPRAEQGCTNSLPGFPSSVTVSTAPLGESTEIHELSSFSNDSVDRRDGGGRMLEDEAQAAMVLPEEDDDPGHGLQIFQVKMSNLLVFMVHISSKRREVQWSF